MERVAVELSGVPATLLWNLGRRAAATRLRGAPLDDPRAVDVVARLDYDFHDATRGAKWHAVRVATFDAAVRRFLTQHPAGTVVALGEGLETQFWRVDNGHVRWVTVDLPETLALRHQLLPDGPRQRSHAASALSLGWLDEVDPAEPALVTAQGLLMYFHRDQVRGLIAAIAGQRPNVTLIFDAVPERMREMTRHFANRESREAVDLWSWVFGIQERAALCGIPGVSSVRDLAPPLAPGIVPLVGSVIRRLPRRVRYVLPVFPVLQVAFSGTT